MYKLVDLIKGAVAFVFQGKSAPSTNLPTMTFEQASGLVNVGANMRSVEDVLGAPQIVTKRERFEIRNYLLSPGAQNRMELFTGVFQGGLLVNTRHIVLKGNH